MNERLVLELEQMSKQHSDNLEVALEACGLTRKEATRKLMRGEEVPMEVYGQICYLDSVNSIINKINCRNIDNSTWLLADYVDSLFDYLQDYIKDNNLSTKGVMSTPGFKQMGEEYNGRLPSFILASAVKHKDSFIIKSEVE